MSVVVGNASVLTTGLMGVAELMYDMAIEADKY
jgi:hypothetical protein